MNKVKDMMTFSYYTVKLSWLIAQENDKDQLLSAQQRTKLPSLYVSLALS